MRSRRHARPRICVRSRPALAVTIAVAVADTFVIAHNLAQPFAQLLELPPSLPCPTTWFNADIGQRMHQTRNSANGRPCPESRLRNTSNDESDIGAQAGREADELTKTPGTSPMQPWRARTRREGSARPWPMRTQQSGRGSGALPAAVARWGRRR